MDILINFLLEHFHSVVASVLAVSVFTALWQEKRQKGIGGIDVSAWQLTAAVLLFVLFLIYMQPFGPLEERWPYYSIWVVPILFVWLWMEYVRRRTILIPDMHKSTVAEMVLSYFQQHGHEISYERYVESNGNEAYRFESKTDRVLVTVKEKGGGFDSISQVEVSHPFGDGCVLKKELVQHMRSQNQSFEPRYRWLKLGLGLLLVVFAAWSAL